MIVHKWAVLAGAAALCASTLVQAQVPQYGTNISLEQAKKASAAAEAEARKNSWPVCIAIVDTAGHLVHYERIDNTQTGSVMVCQDKAVSAAIYRRPTKVFADRIAAGGAGMTALNLRSASTVDGGLPIYIDGKIVGAIGVSGVNADQDAMVAKAGAESLATK
jgi:glc operon protein GlcG